MKNIPLQVNIEGQHTKVDTDWFATKTALKKRGLSKQELTTIYFEVCAGMKVTTRGLCLAKPAMSSIDKMATYEAAFLAHN